MRGDAARHLQNGGAGIKDDTLTRPQIGRSGGADCRLLGPRELGGNGKFRLKSRPVAILQGSAAMGALKRPLPLEMFEIAPDGGGRCTDDLYQFRNVGSAVATQLFQDQSTAFSRDEFNPAAPRFLLQVIKSINQNRPPSPISGHA
ncbi:MAG TPA: hypothetical protein VM659_23815 [Dongiaceae bacterium]|nr:hypothetical protein [Dongiaceae bacterium]